jgi:DNA polymerase-3 subunit beta
MMDFLKEIENNEFTLGINEQNLPFVLKNANLTTIIMPIAL